MSFVELFFSYFKPQPLTLLQRPPFYHKTILDPELIQAKLNKEFSYAREQQEQSKLPSRVTFYTPANAFLNAPAETHSEIHTETAQVGAYQAKIASYQGLRPTMEDAHIAQMLPCFKKQIPLFGIFDGHNGKKASHFLKEKLPFYLTHYLEKFNPSGNFTDTGIWNALKHAFIELDHDFTGPEGSTATICLLINGHIWTANLGDSRAILTPNIQLSEDAKPTNPRYQNSIFKRGGFVLWDRINGNLAVGRAFGDHGLPVPHAPKITKHPILPKSHLLIACDGLWDVASTAHVSAHIEKDPNPAHVVYKAAYAGSTDNISVLIVKL